MPVHAAPLYGHSPVAIRRRNEAEERRLLQLYFEALTQCPIEDRVTSRVHEIREQDGICPRQRNGLMQPRHYDDRDKGMV
jgi:hypothetical protein